jgi:hypothetical protein
LIEVDGRQYKVVETLGWQAGYQVKVLYVPDEPTKEKVAVKRNGKWEWWTVKDRLGK